MRRFTFVIAVFTMVSIVSATGWAGLGDGLVAHYPFNGNAEDVSGNGYHATIHGATLTEDRFGNPNHAYELTENYGPYGGGNYIELPDMIDGFNELTLSLWVKEYEIGYIHAEAYIHFGIGHAESVEIANWDVEDGTMHFMVQHTDEARAEVITQFDDNWRYKWQHYA